MLPGPPGRGTLEQPEGTLLPPAQEGERGGLVSPSPRTKLSSVLLWGKVCPFDNSEGVC